MPRPTTPLLSRAGIRAAALEIIDRDGLDGLSMRKLATALSVSAKQPSVSPEQNEGSQRCFCSAVPYAWMVLATSPSVTDTIPRTDVSPRPSSSMTSA